MPTYRCPQRVVVSPENCLYLSTMTKPRLLTWPTEANHAVGNCHLAWTPTAGPAQMRLRLHRQSLHDHNALLQSTHATMSAKSYSFSAAIIYMDMLQKHAESWQVNYIKCTPTLLQIGFQHRKNHYTKVLNLVRRLGDPDLDLEIELSARWPTPPWVRSRFILQMATEAYQPSILPDAKQTQPTKQESLLANYATIVELIGRPESIPYTDKLGERRRIWTADQGYYTTVTAHPDQTFTMDTVTTATHATKFGAKPPLLA